MQPQQGTQTRTNRTAPNMGDLDKEFGQMKLDSQCSRNQQPPRSAPRGHGQGERHGVAVMQPHWENTTTTSMAPNTQPPVRAHTGFEFQTSNRGTTFCTNCREIGTHQWQHCHRPSFCSICQKEGHRDARHNSATGTQQSHTRGQWGNQASRNMPYQRSWVSGGINQAGQTASNGQGASQRPLNPQAPSFGPYTGTKPKDNEPTA